MAGDKVNHNVIKAFTSQAVTAASGSTAGTATSEWFDTNGWTDKKISFEYDITSGSIAVTTYMQVSPQHYYELNNKTCTTEDYVQITLNASAHTAAIMSSYDAGDVDDLQRPFRSTRLVISNAGSSALTANYWIEGWS